MDQLHDDSMIGLQSDTDLVRVMFRSKLEVRVLREIVRAPVRLNQARRAVPEWSKQVLIDTLHGLAGTWMDSVSGVPADAAAEVIVKAVMARKPRTRYTVGRDAAVITCRARILPDRTLDRVLAAALRPHFPLGSPNASNANAGRHAAVPVAGRFLLKRIT